MPERGRYPLARYRPLFLYKLMITLAAEGLSQQEDRMAVHAR
ncbi:Uncharacterised protein [Mycobacterium tuberculosis]|nr:Uncharacterised protein [Mycobacterium tuberculosis]